MKKLLFAATVTILCIGSCNDAGKNTPEKTTDLQAKNNDSNTREVYNAMETGDVSRLDSFISKDIIDHDGSNGQEVRGIDSLKASIKDMRNHVKDLKMNIEAMASNDNYSFDMVTLTGTAMDNSWGMPAGTKIVSKSVNVVKIKDGMAVEHWRFMDVAEAMAMMRHPSVTDNGKSGDKK